MSTNVKKKLFNNIVSGASIRDGKGRKIAEKIDSHDQKLSELDLKVDDLESVIGGTTPIVDSLDFIYGGIDAAGKDNNTTGTTRVRTDTPVSTDGVTFQLIKEGYEYIVHIYSTTNITSWEGGYPQSTFSSDTNLLTLPNGKYFRILLRKANNSSIAQSDLDGIDKIVSINRSVNGLEERVTDCETAISECKDKVNEVKELIEGNSAIITNDLDFIYGGIDAVGYNNNNTGLIRVRCDSYFPTNGVEAKLLAQGYMVKYHFYNGEDPSSWVSSYPSGDAFTDSLDALTFPEHKYYRILLKKANNGNISSSELGNIGNIIEVKHNSVGLDERLEKIEARQYGDVTISKKSATLASGATLQITECPKSVVSSGSISLSAKVNSFGNGIVLGKGTTEYTSAWISINGSSVSLYVNGAVVGSPIPHGLTIDTYINAVINVEVGKWKVIVSTKANTADTAGVFTHTFDNHFGNGFPRVTSSGASLTDVELKYSCDSIHRSIWAFGDSYFGSSTSDREMYWLNQWGYLNFMKNGFGGCTSAESKADLLRCLSLGTPRTIIWCLGMNDNQSTIDTWKNHLVEVEGICKDKGIELIVATIPQVKNTSYKNKVAMSEFVRGNFRFIDVAKAVGSNANGEWYGNGTTFDYQSSDNVHPTEYGAKAIATQFLVDVPEIMAE